ncbi:MULTISPECIES: hypothetical protein [unclassified Streptomyces]|uniref:hypothetical protein n=1 Tax=unclassified Streptomyces TaxID=2593676 RepID=UPI003647EA00
MRHTSKFRLAITVIVGLLSGASTSFGVIAAGDRELNLAFLALGALAAAAAAGLTFLVQGHQPPVSPAALSAGKRADVVFQAGVRPVAESLAALASMSTPDADLRGKINRSLIEIAAHLVEDGPSVASFYALEKDPDKAGAERLAKRAISRESVEMPDHYKADKAAGSYLLDIATGTKDRYVEKIEEDPERWRINLADGYVTALFVPVRAGEEPKGILIVQAAAIGAIADSEERKKYSAIAHLIGASQATADLTAYVRSLPAQANGSGQDPQAVNGTPANGRDPQNIPGPDSGSTPDGERN